MNYIVIDLETTGLDFANDEIIEIGAVKIIDGIIAEKFSTFVKPNQKITLPIQQITGINDEMVADAPEIDEAIISLKEFSGDIDHFIAHNANFESTFLRPFLGDNIKWLDTIDIGRIVRPTERSYSLGELIDLYGIVNDNAHRALSDAYVTAELFLEQIKELKALPQEVWRTFVDIIGSISSPLALFILDVGNDIIKTLPLGTLNVIEYVTRHFAPLREQDLTGDLPHEKDYTIDLNQLKNQFVAKDKLPAQIENFEARQEQLEMTNAVADAMNNSKILLAEAGTGTGKSLAYLVPAVMYSLGSGKPVVVSTHTINLQEQLSEKDIPLIQNIAGEEVRCSLVKGRSNYICIRKWKDVTKSCDEFILPFVLRVAVWLSITKTGDGSEMNLYGLHRDLWQRVAAFSETCAMGRCPYSKKKCFVTIMRKKAELAHIVIVNHSLLLSNAVMKARTGIGILPNFEHLIIDEAHNLDKVAEDQLTFTLSHSKIEKALYGVYRKEKSGYKGRIQTLIKDLGVTYDSRLMEAYDLAAELKDDYDELFVTSNDFFRISHDILPKDPYGNPPVLRLKEGNSGEIIAKFENEISNLIVHLQTCMKKNTRLMEILGDSDNPDYSIDAVGDLRFANGSLLELLQSGQKLVDADLDKYVIWLDSQNLAHEAVWHISPVEIAEELNTDLYEKMQSIVFTSATMSGSDDFGYFKNTLGIDKCPHDVEYLQLQSPFDYKNQSKICIYEDLPDHNSTETNVSVKAIADVLIKSISAAGGRTLVLFTSHQQLKAVYNKIARPLEDEGIKVLAHGISGSRTTLLSALRKNPNTCILGASSFWEGVDISGDALSLVIAVRLPFLPPNNPTMEAKMERLEKEGKNSFKNCSLPQAVIRFKQGFGRLIRSSQDRGIFMVLDRRIFEKSYGKQFLKALPEMEIIKGNGEVMAEEIKEFLN